MGWAVKYKELARLMYQSQYIFDISNPKINTQEILRGIRDMENNLDLNKKILRERLSQVQNNSPCFNAVREVLDKVAGGRS